MAEIGRDIKKAKKILQNSGIVAIPTETVYGLAANVFDEIAVTKIFEVKKRPFFDPLIVHTHSIESIKEIVKEIPDIAYKLADKFWPGPLTMLFNKTEVIPSIATAGLNKVAIRIPNHSLTLELLKAMDFPIVAPSANPFGYISPTSSGHVNAQLGDKIPYILDGGPCQIGIESTIIDVNETPKLYRAGGVSIEKLKSTLNEIDTTHEPSSNPEAPGMLKEHYSPIKKMIIGNIPELLKKYEEHQIGVLSFKTIYSNKNIHPQLLLSEKGNLNEAAKNLFHFLRLLDTSSCDIILAERVPNIGLGLAINDRLNRASQKIE